MLDSNLVALLRCPIDGGALRLSSDGLWLIHTQAGRRYPIEGGIAMLLPEQAQSFVQAVEKVSEQDNG